MSTSKSIVGLLAAVMAAVAFGAVQASASNAPIVITYAKSCTGDVCDGTAGTGGTLHMKVTSYRPTGAAAQLTLTEWITVGGVSFRAELNGHEVDGAGFIVLDGTVTAGAFSGARIHQRSNLMGVEGDTTLWTGQLQLMPATQV
jgi:hypothetical protein